MDSYLYISSIALILTTISFIMEIKYPFIDDLTNINILGMLFFRYMHLLVGIYLITFLCFFDARGSDGIIYLLAVIIVEFFRHLCGCCILSYYELLMYNNLNYPTNYHPTTVSLCRNHDRVILNGMRVVVSITFFYILFKNKMSLIYKLLVGAIFSYLFLIRKKQPIKKYTDIKLTLSS